MLVIDAYLELFKLWSTIEYKRFVERKIGLFPDNGSSCENALVALLELGAHISELTETTLSTARMEQAGKRFLFTSTILRRYQECQELLVHFSVPLMLHMPRALIHESIFSSSTIAFSYVSNTFVSFLWD